MYLRNFLAAASFVALVASAALPETQGAYVPGFEKSCVEGCKADGTANENCYGWCPQCDASLSDDCLAEDKI
ncbi:hypothetical protein J7T55_009857 [Diaporthe amygdali]|uniref:uncharacterized protein n=1 Tax=Phomopsis amygdali TaxID=1214568 RepID=UPI0022FDDB3B|nr:uncharacterized protein J7T55_009857 [Diaporthe amygdali]KAJ0116707.1 hypothetical protein J7T55_009857 [Diaporthe amygdali]